MQRPLVILMLLALITAGTVWWFASEDEPTLPAQPATAPATRQQTDGSAGPGARVEVSAPVAEQVEAKASRPQEQDVPAQPPGLANLIVKACSSGTREPLGQFEVTFQHGISTLSLPKVRAEGEDGEARLAVPPGRAGELLVEADGHEPCLQEVQAPRFGEPPRSLELFLDPVAAASGITLAVHDPYRRPIANVRVRASILGDPQPDDDWAGARPLWSRRAANAGGLYELPELAPGRYGIRLAAIDADGALLSLQPFARVFTLTGSNGFREDVILEPGCLLTLDLVDIHETSLDPEENEVSLDLRLTGGPRTTRLWHQRGEQGLLAGIDSLPGPGPCWLDEAIAPGHYTLSVRVGQRLRIDKQQLVLPAGESLTERILVR